MARDTKTVKRNYIYNLLYEILILAVPLITTPYVSRVLGADGVGIYSYTLSIATYFTLFAKLGTQTYGQLEIAANRDSRENMSLRFWEITILKCISVFVAILVYILVIIIDSKYVLYYCLLLLTLLNCAVDFTWFFQGIEEFGKIVLRNTFVKIISVICIFLFVHTKDDLPVYFLIIQGSIIGGNFMIIPSLRKYLIKINWTDINIITHVKPCLAYFLPTVATTIYLSLDKSMIGWITHSSFENGYYEQAHKIEQVAATVVTSLSAVTMPRMAYWFKNGNMEKIKSFLEETLKFILFISLPMCIGLISIAPILVPWFLGNEYRKSIVLLKVFSVLIVVIGLNNAVGKQVLMASGKQKEYNSAVIIGALLNACVNAILIPSMQSIGAAIASVLAETIILVLFVKYTEGLVKIKKLIGMSKNYIIGSVVMGSGISIVNNLTQATSTVLWIIIDIGMGVLMYFSVLIILRDEIINKNLGIIRDKIKK